MKRSIWRRGLSMSLPVIPAYVRRLTQFARARHRPLGSKGFTIVEAIIGCIVFGIIVAVMLNSFIALKSSYTTARQLNEIYTVLSACPEVDRALEFSTLTSSSNCYPNNTFPAENGGSGTITYVPTLTVTDSTSLASPDPLRTVPDSKVVLIDVGFPRPNTAAPHLQLRMLITRNGVGQL